MPFKSREESIPSFGCGTLKLIQASGGMQHSASTCSGNVNHSVNLTTTGTHILLVDPQDAATGGATVEVTNP